MGNSPSSPALVAPRAATRPFLHGSRKLSDCLKVKRPPPRHPNALVRRRSIWVIPKGEPSASVLLAAQGRGVRELQRGIVVHHDPHGSTGLRLGTPCSLSVPDAMQPKVGLAQRWMRRLQAPQLHQAAARQEGARARRHLALRSQRRSERWRAHTHTHHQTPLPALLRIQGPRVEPAGLWSGPAALRSFVQAPIGPPSAPLGVLLLAKTTAAAFEGIGWQVQLQLAATALVAIVRNGQVQRMAQLLRRMDSHADPVAMIGALLRVRRPAAADCAVHVWRRGVWWPMRCPKHVCMGPTCVHGCMHTRV